MLFHFPLVTLDVISTSEFRNKESERVGNNKKNYIDEIQNETMEGEFCSRRHTRHGKVIRIKFCVHEIYFILYML